MLIDRIIARLQSETAMRPYKPKTPAQMRLKTDPAHRMMREAYKRRNGTDKTHDKKQDQLYYRKNKAQLKQRQRRSRMLHKSESSEFKHWCYEYVWEDGLRYGITIHGTRYEADCHAQRLQLIYSGELVEVFPVTDEELQRVQTQLTLAKTYENNSGQTSNSIVAHVYAGRPSVAARRNLG